MSQADSTGASARSLVVGPPGQRRIRPGMVRFAVTVPSPVRAMTWSGHRGVAVSTLDQVINISSRGVRRWSTVAGSGHRVFPLGDHDIVWAPQFGSVFQILRQGRRGWTLPWQGTVAPGHGSHVLLLEAATVAALTEEGALWWRIAVPEVRALEAPFSCADGYLFPATRGSHAAALYVTKSGRMAHFWELPEGSRVVAATRGCAPVVWERGTLYAVDANDVAAWRVSIPQPPVVARTERGYAVITSGGVDHTIAVHHVADDGRILLAAALPLHGRVARAAAVGTGSGSWILSLCRDVTSPCARMDRPGAPFDTVLLVTGDAIRIVERIEAGDAAPLVGPDSTWGIAVSPGADVTELTWYAAGGAPLWSRRIPGRLSAAPFLGPWGGVYVATCAGHGCAPPYRLVSVTAFAPPQDAGPD